MKLFKSLLRNRVAKNAGWLIAGNIAQMIVSFFVNIFTVRYLGPSNYGLINYAGAYTAFFTSFCTLGLGSNIIMKAFSDNPGKDGEVLGSAMLLRAVSSFLSALMIIGIVSFADRGEPLTITVVAVCCLGLEFQIFTTLNYWFQSKLNSKVSSIVSLTAYIITSLFKILLLALQKSVVWFAFATSLDLIVSGLLLYISYRRNGGNKLSFSRNIARSLFKSGAPYILIGLMVAVYGYTDKLMLKQMLNTSEVGYYSTAAAICAMWTFVLKAVIDSMSPSIIEAQKHDPADYENANCRLYAMIIYPCIAVSLIFSFFGKYIILLLYGIEYLPAAIPFRILTWYTMFSYLGVARGIWVVCEDLQKKSIYISVVSAFFNVILNLVLIPRMGASGAALATLMTECCAVFVFPLFKREYHANIKLMLKSMNPKYLIGEIRELIKE